MKITYTRPDGGVSVIAMASQADVAFTNPAVGSMTQQQFINWIIAKDVPVGSTNVSVVQDGDVPAQPATIPDRISMAQAELALLQSALLDAVEALIAGQGRAAQIEWRRRLTVERTHPLVQLAKAELPLTESQLDDLFTLGATL